MRIFFTKSKWEMWDDPLEDFLRRAASDGFDAVEIYLPAQPESPAEIAARVADHGLQLVAQISTEGATLAEHLATLEKRFAAAIETVPVLINSHTGRDIFPFEDNLAIFRRACELSQRSGIVFTAETHRSRPTGNGPGTRRLVEALPELRLNADFSHWACVHESDLSDQPENVDLAIQRASHIHARVGFDQGPQVPDPLASEWGTWTERHLAWWQRIIDARKADGTESLTITPEFGPPPYMPLNPKHGSPLADAWTINFRFKNYLKMALHP